MWKVAPVVDALLSETAFMKLAERRIERFDYDTLGLQELDGQ